MVGSITSTTVTTAVHEEEFELSSVTIKKNIICSKVITIKRCGIDK
jgi:hypothetical protein